MLSRVVQCTLRRRKLRKEYPHDPEASQTSGNNPDVTRYMTEIERNNVSEQSLSVFKDNFTESWASSQTG